MEALSIDYIKEKWAHTGFQRYLRNTGWMFFGRMFTLVLSFFVSIYMARSLGVEDFGTLNFIISFVSIAGPCLFVIESIYLKKLISEPENRDTILGSALIIKIGSAGLLILTSTIGSIIFANTNKTSLLVLLFSTFSIFQSIHLIDYYFQSKAEAKRVVPATILSNTISALIKIVIIYLHLDISYLLMSYVFDYIIMGIGYMYLYNKYVGKILDWRVDYSLIKRLLIDSIPFTISAIATTIYMKVDQVFLKAMIGSSAVGLYVVAVRFSEVWFVIPSVICASLLPAIINAVNTDHNMFLSRSKRLYSLLFYSALAICVFIIVFAPLIVNILYGSQYQDSIGLLRIYVWSIIGVFVGTALQQFLLAQNRFKTILTLNIMGMVLSLALNYYFIPIFGIKGAAVANIFAYTLPVLIVLFTPKMIDQRRALLSAIFRPLSIHR